MALIRETGEVMLSKKIAEIADVTVGDPITLHDTDAGDVTLTVSGIFENYVWHYAYITPECYEQYFGQSMRGKYNVFACRYRQYRL